MLSKEKHIDYWLKSSEDDWETVLSLVKAKRYLHALFFAHLSLEKLCKAIWVHRHKENLPPRIHHLVKLILASDIILEEDDLIFLQSFNDFQIEGRYPDYLFKINKICTFDFTVTTLQKVIFIKKCLLKNLP
jgi:HEPN domain-containing protein